MVAGSETSTGQTLIGQTVELAPGEIADIGCEYVALGHIHKRQGWGNVWYSGSPNRHDFGEVEPKGWNLATITDGKLTDVEFVELPARRIVLIEEDWTAGVGEIPSDDVTPEALVRFRYRIHPEDLHLVNEEAIEGDLRAHGAYEVKIEAVLVHEARVRSADIASAKDTWAKLTAYWQAAGIDVPETNRIRIREKLDGIENRQREEVGHEA
jgi:DNA repair exonuclease SbcCD nuclease subunit